MRVVGYVGVILAVIMGPSRALLAQETALPQPTASGPNDANSEAAGTIHPAKTESTDEERSGLSVEQRVAKLSHDFLEDQKQIWTSPARLRFSDTEWLVPLSGITAGLFVTDSDFNRHISHSPSTISHYKNLSNAGMGALIGGAGGMWLLGHVKHNSHWTETGFLAGEAALNSLVMAEAMKYSLRRERPYVDNANGDFFHSGGTSFPSESAAAAWSVAGVIAHEYPGPLTKIAAYGLASLVDFSRIRGQQHFPSDVLVGSVIGNLVAQNIYSRRHDDSLSGDAWRSISQVVRSSGSASPANQGSPYVPLDSWIYPALDRLAAVGFIDTGFAGMRPWTRRECLRLLSEAEDKVNSDESENTDAASLVASLKREFHGETEQTNGSDNATFRLESVYSRTEQISGMPLTDGYHFAYTQFDDFGRPFGEGWSTVNGFSMYGAAGRWVGYVRGEWQTAPSIPALPLSTRVAIEQMETENGTQVPLQPGTPEPAVSQFELLDTYVGLMVSNWQVSFGKQSLYWGSGQDGSLELTDNIVPINMFRINRTTPIKLPSILGWLGSMRTEFFLGRLAGYEFMFSPLGLTGQWGQALPNQPFIHGQNISFKPTPNFEFGFYRTTIFGGEGYDFTAHRLIASLFDLGDAPAGSPNKPGKRTSGLDLSYRLPWLRHWATIYADGLTYDEFSPIAYPTWSAWHSGLYFSHFPRLRKLDLRVEGVYTDVPKRGGTNQPGTWYSNGAWRSGYTNNGNIIGSWIGRGGQGAQAWSNYWFSPRNRVQLNFRHQKVSQEYLPGGGTLTDFGGRSDYSVRPDLSLGVSVQYERWLFPVIQPSVARNISTSIQVLFEPHKLFQHPSGAAMGDVP